MEEYKRGTSVVLTKVARLPNGLLLAGSLGKVISSTGETSIVTFPFWPVFTLRVPTENLTPWRAVVEQNIALLRVELQFQEEAKEDDGSDHISLGMTKEAIAFWEDELRKIDAEQS